MMNYYVDDKGTLKVFDGNDLVTEVQQCQNMTEGEIQCLADELYKDYTDELYREPLEEYERLRKSGKI